MCSLYSLTKGQQAIREFASVVTDRTGNLPPLPGIYPDYLAPVVRNRPEGREQSSMRFYRRKPPVRLPVPESRPTSLTRSAASCSRPRRCGWHGAGRNRRFVLSRWSIFSCPYLDTFWMRLVLLPIRVTELLESGAETRRGTTDLAADRAHSTESLRLRHQALPRSVILAMPDLALAGDNYWHLGHPSHQVDEQAVIFRLDLMLPPSGHFSAMRLTTHRAPCPI
jgi:hypothetical protein